MDMKVKDLKQCLTMLGLKKTGVKQVRGPQKPPPPGSRGRAAGQAARCAALGLAARERPVGSDARVPSQELYLRILAIFE